LQIDLRKCASHIFILKEFIQVAPPEPNTLFYYSINRLLLWS
jgi:hypothetical protein